MDDGYTQQQPPLTSADVAAFIARVERSKKHVICAPDVYERLRDAVYGAGFGISYRVVKCAWLDDGQVLLGPSDEELDEMLFPPVMFDGQREAPAGEAGA